MNKVSGHKRGASGTLVSFTPPTSNVRFLKVWDWTGCRQLKTEISGTISGRRGWRMRTGNGVVVVNSLLDVSNQWIFCLTMLTSCEALLAEMRVSGCLTVPSLSLLDDTPLQLLLTFSVYHLCELGLVDVFL